MDLLLRSLLYLLPVFLLSGNQAESINARKGTLKVTFRNTIRGEPMVLDAATYINPFGESYTVSKFKYYISNLALNGIPVSINGSENYHLIDQREESTLSFELETEEQNLSELRFLLGVDSLRNSSGAQTGALDPLNDMFWTWNNGYVMAKMEGSSPVSAQPRHLIEYHIGGFSGANNVLKVISLALPTDKTLLIKKDAGSEIIVEADFNKWWQTPNDLKIADVQVCTTPGVLAKKIADNYSKMFTIAGVVNN
jgi:hypothetical protein